MPGDLVIRNDQWNSKILFSCKHAIFCRIKGFDGVAVDLHLIVALAIMRYSEVLLHSTIAIVASQYQFWLVWRA